ncbi:hypothetical protein NQP46_30705 [Streptomyces albus]|nr:hypothetical protein NQP46_30705 [Streptomyces albus]
MSVIATVAALRASTSEYAERLTTVRHEHVDDTPFVLIPLTLAEACAPLAALAGTDPDHPALLTVRRPHDRTERFGFVESLADLLLPYFEECRAAPKEPYTVGRGKDKEERERPLRAPQLLVPNAGGITYVRLLGRLTRLRATDGPHAVSPSVPLLGKRLTWFADRAEFPDSALLQAMTRSLSAHWATGQSPTENANLASLLGWIDPPPDAPGPRPPGSAKTPRRGRPPGRRPTRSSTARSTN